MSYSYITTSLLAAGFLNILPTSGPELAEETECGSKPQAVWFSEHLVADNYGYTFGVAAADLDGDGDLDLTSPDIQGKKQFSTLFWFENDGKGRFTRRVIHDREPGWFERHVTADINRDGRPDIAIVNNQKGQLVWFANPGQGVRQNWARHVITTQCPYAYDIVLSDFDGDGDLDAASSGWLANEVSWYENSGKIDTTTEWARYVIDSQMPETRTIVASDFNHDGRMDLLATAVGKPVEVPDNENSQTSGAQVIWYENTRQTPSPLWKKHVIDTSLSGPIHGHPVDLDSDGDQDVVMAHGRRIEADPDVGRHGVVWYENVGLKQGDVLWQRHVVGPLPYAFEAVASDLDGDGDQDVVATAWSKGDRVVWFENKGAWRDWKMHVIKVGFHAANQVIVADLDGDQLPDIVSSSDDGSRRVQGSLELRWWKNEGSAGSQDEE